MALLKKEMIDVEVKLSKMKGDFDIIDNILNYKELYTDDMEASLSYICYIESCLKEIVGIYIPFSEEWESFEEINFTDNGAFDGREFVFLTRGDDLKRLSEIKAIIKPSDKDILNYISYLEEKIKTSLEK